jgi:dTDP-4-dehydrorhamnose reductase
MRILVTGAEGILGHAVREWLASRHTLLLWDRDEADIRDEAAVREAARGIAFDAVIHGAAMTEVDRCETEFELALATNRDGTRHIARLARERGARLVAVSTDYVFDGTKDGPYLEDDPTAPINAYGRSKLAGEDAAREEAPGCLVVRTSWLYGPGGRNFVDTIAAKLERGEVPEVVNDQRGCPTYARDLARGIERLLCRGASGTVHVTNAGDTTWHGLAEAIARRLGPPASVLPTTSDRFPRPARRPVNSILSGERYRGITGESLPRWEEALGDHLARRAASRRGIPA